MRVTRLSKTRKNKKSVFVLRPGPSPVRGIGPFYPFDCLCYTVHFFYSLEN